MGRNPGFRILTVSVEFEIRGEIQGLYFLTHCKEEASKLGILGWVKEDIRGTIYGVIQGRRPKVEEMMSWLTQKGLPGCRIDECGFYNYQYKPRPDYRNFSLRF